MALQHLRSGTANKRPLPTAMSDGQLAVNTNLASPGLFFKDSNGDLVKVGPVHIGTTAPNTSPASTAATALVANTIYKILTVGTSDFTAVGASSNAVGVVFTASGTTTGTGTVSGEQGNEKGEMWLDNTGGAYDLKIYDGTAWRSQAGEFVNATGDTMTGDLIFNNANVVFEGSAADDHETTLTVANPTADRTITLPNVSGTVVTTGDTGSVTSTMLLDGTIANADVSASAAIAGTKVSPDFGSQAITTTGIINANGKVSFPLGSKTAPSLLPGSDTNTGIFSPGGDQIAIATNGEQRVSINAAGEVLIGVDSTLSPIAQRQLMLVTQGGGQLAFARNDSTTSAGNHIGELVFFGKGGGTYQRCGRIAVEADDNHAINDKPSRMVFETTADGESNPTVRMNIDSAGRVGIGGTAIAGTIFHVIGSSGSVQFNDLGDKITFTRADDNTITAPSAGANLKYIAADTHYFSGDRVEIVGPTEFYVSNGSNTNDGVLMQPTQSSFFGDIVLQAPGLFTKGTATISSVAGMFVGGIKGITDSTIKTSLLSDGRIDAGALTVNLNLTPSAGTSVEHFYSSTGGVIQAFDRDNSNLEPLRVRGSTWDLGLDGSATFAGGITSGGDQVLETGSLNVYQSANSSSTPVFNGGWSSGGRNITSSIFSNGSATFGSTTTVGGAALSGGAAGVSLFPTGGIHATQASGTSTVFSGYIQGSSTKNVAITAAGSAAFGRASQISGIAGDSSTSVFEQLSNSNYPLALHSAQTNKRGLGIFYAGTGAGSSDDPYILCTNQTGVKFQVTSAGGATFLSHSMIGRTTYTSLSTNGHYFSASGWVHHSVDGDASVYINRNVSDGALINFDRAGARQGSISVSGSTVSYNGAHLARWSQLPGGVERTEILRGSVLSNLDEMCEWTCEAQDAVLYTEEDELPEGVSVGDVKTPAVVAGTEDNEQLNRMQVSTVEGDKNVSGVFQAWDDDDDTYVNDFYCAMTGDFVIRIAQGTTVTRGDLLMSAGDGTAKPQDDDIIRSKTIAKVTSTNVSETYADGSFCVPCVLMAC